MECVFPNTSVSLFILVKVVRKRLGPLRQIDGSVRGPILQSMDDITRSSRSHRELQVNVHQAVLVHQSLKVTLCI